MTKEIQNSVNFKKRFLEEEIIIGKRNEKRIELRSIIVYESGAADA